MQLQGIHHISAITGDAQRNLDFYTRVLGLRLVAKTVNQDDPSVYHLFYADEQGHPGSEMTFFEYPHAIPGRPGAGMVHRIVWRVGASRRWTSGSSASACSTSRSRATRRSARSASPTPRASTTSWSSTPAVTCRWPPSIPRSRRPMRCRASTAFAPTRPTRRAAARCSSRSSALSKTGEHVWTLRGERRGGWIAYDPAPAERGRQSGGSVHHVAWGTDVAEHPTLAGALRGGGPADGGIIDRTYFKSIYFREPSGVLFEIADDAPGFTIDSPVEELGRKIILPPQFESRRELLEARLTPLPDPRAGWATRA